MIRLEPEKEKFTVWRDDCCIGTAMLYDNPCHMGNRYVKMELDQYDPSASAELFRQLREIAGRPLQMMVSSDDAEQVQFLTAGGFVCKRKCYEVEAGAADYLGERSKSPLNETHRGEAAYDRCCKILFDYYEETHRPVNPWTAGHGAFVEKLPDTVFFRESDGEIPALAFLEENEIAYVCGRDEGGFVDFAASLIAEMFERYQTIFFESDDCDWAAMLLKSLFANRKETSFDTYVYGR